MIPRGHFHLERSIFKYAEKPYSVMEAMIWLIASAGYNGDGKGKVKIGTRALASAWGWSRSRTHRQLREWQKSGFISLQDCLDRLCGPVGGAVDRTGYLDRFTNEITLPNYTTKQAHRTSRRTGCADRLSEPVSGPVVRTLLNLKEKEEKKYKEEELSSDPSGSSVVSTNSSTKKPDPRIKAMVDLWHNLYLETHDRKPHITGQHGSTFKRLLRTYPDDLEDRIRNYFSDPQSWMDIPDHTIGHFEKKAQAYAQPHSQDDWRISE